MKMFLLLATLACAGLWAQNPMQVYYSSSQSMTSAASLPSAFSFPNTPTNQASTIWLNIQNTSAGTIYIVAVTAAVSNTFSPANLDFSVQAPPGGLFAVAPRSYSTAFSISFRPNALTVSPSIAYLNVYYTTAPGATSSSVYTASTLTGNASPSLWHLSCNLAACAPALLPNASSALNFGNVSTGTVYPVQFTITNDSNAAMTTPAVSLATLVYTPSAFSLDVSNLTSNLAAGQSTSFTVNFGPGQIGLTASSMSTLNVGGNPFPIEGFGVATNPTDALSLTYIYPPTLSRETATGTSTIQFPDLIPGTAAGSSMQFTVSNLDLTNSPGLPVAISGISVTQGNFAISSLSSPGTWGGTSCSGTSSTAPQFPVTLQPNGCLTFLVTFTAPISNTYTGTLSIGPRTFSLAARAVVSPLPSISMQFSEQVLSSGQQVNVSVKAASPSGNDHPGIPVNISFTPSVSGVSDDPAIQFMTTGGRSLSLDLAAGSQTGVFQNQSSFAFQTGTTAGTLTFTLSPVNTQPIVQTFTIAPAAIHITSAQAQRQDPYLVVTINGFDNTYSAGKMTFTFYDLKGKTINSTPLQVDATNDFRNLFFVKNQAGGTFSLQGKFPVTGDVTQIGSVAVTLMNSAGQSSQTITFE